MVVAAPIKDKFMENNLLDDVVYDQDLLMQQYGWLMQ